MVHSESLAGAVEGFKQGSHIVKFLLPQLLHEFEAARLEAERPVKKSITTIQERLVEALN